MYACMCVWVRVCCVSVCLIVHTRTHVNTSYWDQMNRVLACLGQDNIEIRALGTGASMHIRQRHRPCSLRSTHGSTCQPASSSLCPPFFCAPFPHLTTWPNIQILELPFGETVDYRNFTVGVPYNDIANPQQLVEYLHQELTNRYPALRDALHAVYLFAFCFFVAPSCGVLSARNGRVGRSAPQTSTLSQVVFATLLVQNLGFGVQRSRRGA